MHSVSTVRRWKWLILSVFEILVFKNVRKVAKFELFLHLLHNVIRYGICNDLLRVEALRLLLLLLRILLLLVVAIVLIPLHVVLLLLILRVILLLLLLILLRIIIN